MMPGRPMPMEHKRPDPPKSLKDLPRYLSEVFGGFFQRFFYIVKLVWKTGWWIPVILSFVALFKGITPVIGSLISKNILNALQEVIAAGHLPESEFWSSGILYLLIALFAYRLLILVVNNVSSAINRIAGEKVVMQVKSQIMEKSKEVDLASFDNPAFYEKMENANREAGHRPLHILTETFGIVSSVIELVSFLIVLLSAPGLSWITFVVIFVSVPSAVVNFVYRRKNFRYMRFSSKERRQMNYFSSVLVDKDLVKEIRLYDLADTFIARFFAAFKSYYKGMRKLILSESAWHILFSVVTGLTNLVFYIIIAKQVFTGQIQIGDYTLYTGAIASVATCISTLISATGTIYEGTLFIDNLIAFMEEKQHIAPQSLPGEEVARNAEHTIEFVNVSFRYPGTKRDVLKNISFTIHPGQTLALVGLNGAGKTTLIKLLTRLYDPTAGHILMDGKDLRCYELKSLYQTFGIIFQDFGKYAVSVKENIRLGDIHREGSDEEVEAAAKQSTASDYIEKLPDGYNTPLMRYFEVNGLELSVGQWQKLAIARAFYADSDIIILDEPTASLDPMAEQEIFNQFDRLRNNKTTVFVSHRLSSATIADQILVIENGTLIEKGSHTALMAQGGKYAELFTTQSKRYISEGESTADPGRREPMPGRGGRRPGMRENPV
ncbi:MAG: ABC transporter ATP-binding protein [Oscillospiraceae bacterium]|nr:ABC transporter ATP-binding protein [Oscillospiraceae bacterium]